MLDIWINKDPALQVVLWKEWKNRLYAQYISYVVYIRRREGNGPPLQYSCLENPMDGGARWATVHGVAKSQTRLSDFTFTFHFHALEKETATHSSVLAWGIPGTAEPGGLMSMGLHRVGHDWSDLAAATAAFIQATNMYGFLCDMSCPKYIYHT